MKHITQRNWGRASIIFGKTTFVWFCLALAGLTTPLASKGQVISGLAPVQYWWCGPSGGNFGTPGNWSTNGGLLNFATSLLANLTDQNDVMLFNFPSSNNVASTITVNLLESFGGIIVNNTNTTKLTGGLLNLTCTLNGFTNADNSGRLCGLVINPGCGSLVIGGIGVIGSLLPIPLSVGNSQYWINNGTGILAISNTVALSAGANLTLSGTTNIYFNDVISGAAAITNASSATTYFAGNNTFSQGLNIQSGTVALLNAGSIGTGSLTLGIGATLDVSAVTNFILAAPNPLCCSGIGAIAGGTAAIIKCAANGIINLKSCPIVLTCNDFLSPTNPALYIPQGTLSLSNNLFVINTLSGLPLTNGLYVLARLGVGASINTNGVNAYVLAGTALSLGGNNQLLVSSNLITLSIGNASTNAAPVTPSGGTAYYYRGRASGSFTSSHWSTIDSPSGSPTTFASGQNNTAIFNISASNNVNEAVNFNNALLGTAYAGMVFNNAGTTTVTNFAPSLVGLVASPGPSGFTNGTTVYGLVVNAGAGAVTLGASTNEYTSMGFDNGPQQTWVNNSTSLMTVNARPQSAYSGSATLTLGGSGDILVNGQISQQSSGNVLGLVHSGGGTLFLNANNSYANGTTIQGGTVALTNSGALGSGTVAIAAGATLDVSGLTATTFTLTTNQPLVAGGTGTTPGSTAATIKGKSGGTVNLAGQKLTLSYDGANPALYISQGTLALSNNVFIVNTASGAPLTTNKTYVLAQQASGNINVTGGNFTVAGSAFTSGYTYSVSVTSNQVLLSLGFSYWDASGTNWQSTANWSTLASATTPNPAAIPGIYDIPVFNITPSNNIAQTVALNGNVSIAGLVFNNSNSTAITGGNGAYSLTTAGSGITINAGGGSVTLGSAGTSQAVTNLTSTSQTWLNNGSGTLSLLNTLQPTGSNPLTLTLAGSGAFNLAGNIVTNNSAAGTLALDYTGTSTVTLGASNNFQGGITVEQGALLTTPTASAATLNSAFGGNATVNLGNASTNPTAAARIRLSTGTYTNGIALSPATSGTLTLSVVSSNSAVISGGVTGANNLTLFAGTNSTLSFTGAPLNVSGALTAGGNVGATGSALVIYPPLGTSVTALTVSSNAPGAPLVLAGTNAYTGTTTIGGTLMLTNNGSIAASTNIVLSAGGTLDVGGLGAAFTLGANQSLNAGSGTGIIKGNAIVTAGKLALAYTNGVASLLVTNGTLTLSSNVRLTINNISAAALPVGKYLVVAATGGVSGSLPSVTVTGAGVAGTGVPILQAGNGGLYLIVAGQPTTAALTVTLPVGTNLNLAVANLATNWTDPNGTNVTLQSVNALSARGFAVTTNGGFISYVATSAGTDTVSYVVVDGYGMTNTGVITAITKNTTPLPFFTPGTGGYLSPQTVTLTNTEPGSTIYFVTNGVTNVYNGAFTLPPSTNNFVVTTWATAPDEFVSGLNSATYGTITAPIWQNAAGGSWTNGVNWSNNVVGDAAGVTMDFSQLALPTNAIVTVDEAITAGALVFGDQNGTNGWLVTPGSGGSLTLDDGTNMPVIEVVNANTTISAPITSADGLVKTGDGTLTLAGTNFLTGSLVVSNGTLALANAHALDGSTNLIIPAGSTVDVSAPTNFNLPPGQTLTALGVGTNTGTTAATLIGAADGTINLGTNAVNLTFDGSNPSLYVAQGTLVLNDNPFTINAGPLNDGSYVIATSADGITGTGPFSVTGLANGATGVITIVGNQLVLTVTNLTITYSGGANSLPNGNTPVNGVEFDDPSGTTLNGTPNSTLSIGAGGINAGSAAGPVTIGDANGNPALNPVSSQGWTNNSPTVVTVNSPVTNGTTGPITLTIVGISGFDLNGLVTDGNAPLTLVHDDTGTTTLNPSNSFSGGVFVEQGIVASSDAASAASQNNAFGSNPWITLGDDQPDTNSAALSLGTGVLTNGIVLASGSTGDLTVGVQSNATATVAGGIIGTNNVILSGAPGGTLTFTNGPINNQGSVTVASNPATGASGPVMIESPIETNVTAVTVEPSPAGGTNELILNGTNTYTGTTTIGGTLALGATGLIAGSTNIVIEEGGIFDVSSQAHFALAPGQTLTALGAGTGIGTTAATIVGAAGGTVNLGSSPIHLTFDGSNPSLDVAQGTLILDNNPFTINDGPLNDGSYVIATSADGITGTGPFSVTGLANGATGVITIVGNQLVLTVTNPVTTYPGGTNSLPSGNTPVNGVIFNDPSDTTLDGSTNSTLSIGDSGINVAPGSGPVMIGNTNGSPAVDLVGTQTWTNNSTSPVTVNSPTSNGTTNPATLTLTGTKGFEFAGLITDGNGPLSVVQDSAGTTTLNPSNDFSGGAFVKRGTLASDNAASPASENHAFGSNPWVTLGDDQPDTNSASLSLGTGTVTNGILLAAGSTGDLIVGAQSNADATVTGGISGTNNVILSGAPGGTLRFAEAAINHYGSLTVASNPVTGDTGPVVIESAIGPNVTALTVDPSPAGGTNELILGGTNTYTGTTRVAGRLTLEATGSIADSTNIVIDQGGVFDVSSQAHFALAPGQSLTSLGAGTWVGTTAATIIGAAGGTVDLGTNAVTLTYDGSQPALYVAQGTLVLNNNPFTINAGVLTNGDYVIAESADGITGTGPFTVTGLADGASGVITIVGNQLILTVSNLAPVITPLAIPVADGISLKLPVSILATNWIDPNNSVMTLVSVNLTSALGKTVTLSGNTIFYPKTTGNDTITYTIRNGLGATNLGVINIVLAPFTGQSNPTIVMAGGQATVSFAGIPGYTYYVQRTASLTPANWITVSTNTAPNRGLFQLIDANPPQPSAFYRLSTTP